VTLGLEAMRMVEQGVASARDIDTAMELGYNHPKGPLRLTDLVGLDVRLILLSTCTASWVQKLFAHPTSCGEWLAKGN
jgi:3-hydroxybutyryl-CoA dehydrogenase